MSKKSIQQRRLDAVYKYRYNSNSTQQKELLDLLLAMVPHSVIKDIVQELNLKIEK